MDNERGVGSGVAKGEVVDVKSGEVEHIGTMEGGEAPKESVAEKVGETEGGVQQGMPAQPAMPVAVDDEQAGTDQVGDIQNDLVNLTTRDSESIEKEWVNKVQDIVKETRDDPRRREDEVFEVKKNFIFKRFGRKIGGGK